MDIALALNQAESPVLVVTVARNALLSADGNVPDWVELLPPGQQVQGIDGRAWVNDQPNGVVAAFNSIGLPIPLDWEHATEVAAPEGQPAPAAGWIEELQVRDGGSLWGRVNWTPRATDMVRNREYRFLSPAFLYEKDSGRIVRLTSVGLTNRPNLRMTALNRAETPSEDQPMFEKLLELLGLAKNASEPEAIAAVTKLKGELATAQNREASPSLEKFVPRADYEAAQLRATNAEKAISDIRSKAQEQEIEAEIQLALKERKITPATVDYHRAQCGQEGGLERFRAFAKAAPVVAADSGLEGKDPTGGSQTTLTPAQLAVCTAMGLSPEAYKKSIG